MKNRLRKLGYAASIFLFSTMIYSEANAATPVVNTTIKVEKTGSEPFDATSWDGSDLTTAGTDLDENNDVVRMQDSVTYRVEVSVNDAAVSDLIATVLLPDGKQKWIEIPTGCITDPAIVTAVSEISENGRELTCNVGGAVEGTTRVIFPTAKVVSFNEVTNKPVLNAEHTIARVTATATDANTASAGDTDVIITAGFKVDTTKTLKVTSLDPDTGEPLYVAPAKVGPAPGNKEGTLMEYIIKVRYQNGSMLIDSNETDFLIDIGLFDAFTDNNTGNNGAFSSGGKLYTWGPLGAEGACSLIGDHGSTSAVSCTQNNLPNDFLSDTANATGDFTGTTDTLNDPNIDISLTNIDVRDPDSDGNVVEMAINVWFERDSEIKTHQSCNGDNAGEICVNTVINSVGVLSAAGTSIEGYNPRSTEDAGGNNLFNYNGAGEPFANEIDYPMVYTVPGSFSIHQTFNGLFRHEDAKAPDQDVALGETIPLLINHFDYRKIDGGLSQSCDKIDTSIFEYKGLMPAGTLFGTEYYYFNRAPFQQFNPGSVAWGGTEGSKAGLDGKDFIKIYYSDEPNVSLFDQRGDVCEDDVNGDGVAVFDGIDIATGLESAQPSDWVTDASTLVGGMASTTKIRQDVTYKADLVNAFYPSHNNWGIFVNHLLKVKTDATAYGPNSYLPNFLTYRVRNASGDFSAWGGRTDSTVSVDPANIGFSLAPRYADRMHLVPSSIAIAKRTEPKGIKVVRAGDLVDFVIEPQVFGAWDPAVTTATVTDVLPARTAYVPNSERFSIDGGMTWLTIADFNATADVSLESAPNSSATSLRWDFGGIDPDVNGSDQLPLIKYTVHIDTTVTSGSFTNTATLDSEIDNDGGNSPVTAKYSISVFPDFGLDVVKQNQRDIYQTNESFEFELVYKNLGGENYGASDFIDILPYNGDALATTSGLGSNRSPATTYQGIYEVSKLTGTNGETFSATSADPDTIPSDPCHEDNLPDGYVPQLGDLCYTYYISTNTAGVPVKMANTLAGGGEAGTGLITWETCTSLSPVSCGSLANKDITAIRFNVPTLQADAGGKTVKIELTPVGNKGGTPDIDSESNVTANSTGDIYTNTFGGRVPEISLLVISNDVSVTMVSGSIGNTVWVDQDADGIQNGGEAGIPNITMRLLDSSDTPIVIDPDSGYVVPAGTVGAIAYTTLTDGNGNYLFDNLPAGDYKVVVDSSTLPINMLQTFDSDGIATAHTSAITLATVVDPVTGDVTNVADNSDQNFGYKQLAGLGNFVWNDVNHNGVQDDGESGVDGITVTLFDSNGAVVGATATANGGKYSFNAINPGSYSVGFSALPAGFKLTLAEQGLDTLDSDANIVSGKTDSIILAEGDNNITLDAGIFNPASLGSFVWNDLDHDGVQDAGEAGIDGITVTLLDADGNEILDASGSAITTVTAGGGAYLFDDLIPGTYAVGFSNFPADFIATLQDQGDDATDSDINANGKTAPVTLIAGQSNTTLDAGIFNPATLSNFVWNDLNRDGDQDAGEPGIDGVIVTLLDGSGNPLLDASGEAITTQTANGGFYLFDNLGQGTYSVGFSNLPADYDFTLQNQGEDDALDSDVTTATGKSTTVSLVAGENNTTLDAGLFKPGSIGDTIWNDKNNDGVIDVGEGLSSITVTLTPPADIDLGSGLGVAITTETGADGTYSFSNLPAGEYQLAVDESTLPPLLQGKNTIDPDDTANSASSVTLAEGEVNVSQDFAYFAPASIGNTIWEDFNNNGVVDAGEALSDVEVTLLLPDGSTQTKVTDAQGQYLFAGLLAGEYSVTVDETTLPEGLAGHNTVDPDGGNDSSSAITLAEGEENLTQNFAYYTTVFIGNLIWIEDDDDGDATTGTISFPPAGTVVTATATGGQMYTGVTDAQGNYEIAVPKQETYVVTVGTPTDTKASLGSDDNTAPVDDSEENKTHSGAGTTVIIGNVGNTSLDFGFTWLPGDVSVVKTVYGDDDINLAHDGGAGCGTARASDQAIIVDQDKSKDVPVTYCFVATNTGSSYLSDINITDLTLELQHGDLTLLNGPAPALLAPGESLVYYYQEVLTQSLNNTATVTAQPTDSQGNPTLDVVSSQDPSTAEVVLIIDPPSALKTVTPSGKSGMEWQMVWINDSIVAAPDVTVYDEVPEDTTFEALPPGANVSVDGVYCEARGASTTDNCYFETPTAAFPRGRVIWMGTIASDPGKTTEDTAANEVVIRFTSVLTDPDLPNQEIDNQATSEWDFDGDGTTDIAVLSKSPEGQENTTFESVDPSNIPTLSEWVLILLSLAMMLVAGRKNNKGESVIRYK